MEKEHDGKKGLELPLRRPRSSNSLHRGQDLQSSEEHIMWTYFITIDTGMRKAVGSRLWPEGGSNESILILGVSCSSNCANSNNEWTTGRPSWTLATQGRYPDGNFRSARSTMSPLVYARRGLGSAEVP